MSFYECSVCNEESIHEDSITMCEDCEHRICDDCVEKHNMKYKWVDADGGNCGYQYFENCVMCAKEAERESKKAELLEMIESAKMSKKLKKALVERIRLSENN